MAEWKINFDSSVLEGHVKFRDKKTVRENYSLRTLIWPDFKIHPK